MAAHAEERSMTLFLSVLATSVTNPAQHRTEELSPAVHSAL